MFNAAVPAVHRSNFAGEEKKRAAEVHPEPKQQQSKALVPVDLI